MAAARWICLLSYSVSMVAAKVQWDAPTSTRPHAGPFDHIQIPKPTTGPVYRHPHGLMKRALSDQLCGYISSVSVPEFMITCATSSTCTTHSSLPVLGCCDRDTCDFDTTCLDSTACGPTCMMSTGSLTFVCANSLRPYCATFIGENSVSLMICSSGSTPGAQPFMIKSMTKPPSSTPVSITAVATHAGGGAGSSSSSSPSPSPPVMNQHKNTGAIVGGVVGGLAILVLVALGCFFILRKKANNTAATTGGQQPTPYQPGVGYYPTDKTEPELPVPMYNNYPPQQQQQQQQHYAPQPVQGYQQPVSYDQRVY